MHRRHLLADLGHPYPVVRFDVAEPEDAGQQHAPRLPAEQVIERI